MAIVVMEFGTLGWAWQIGELELFDEREVSCGGCVPGVDEINDDSMTFTIFMTHSLTNTFHIS